MTPKQSQPARPQGDTSASAAPPIDEADDHPGTFKYRDLPDSEKPSKTTVAQEQILPDDEKK